jgi:hypothetical protein
VALGDVNGDGKLDVVMANDTSNSVSVFAGNGDGTFNTTTAQTYAVGGVAYAIALGDFNQDGKLDIVTAGAQMNVLLNNGAGAFGTAQQVGPAGNSLVVGDFSGDGFPDLAQIDASGAAIDVLLNNADWHRQGRPPAEVRAPPSHGPDHGGRVRRVAGACGRHLCLASDSRDQDAAEAARGLADKNFRLATDQELHRSRA